MINNFNGSIANLVSKQKPMELSIIAIGLENIEEIKWKFDGLFEIISQCSWNGSKECFVV